MMEPVRPLGDARRSGKLRIGNMAATAHIQVRRQVALLLGAMLFRAVEACNDPGQPVHTDREITGSGIGQLVSYSCTSGYEFMSRPQDDTYSIVCETGDKWNASSPTCLKKVCGEPPDIENSNKTGAIEYGDAYMYTCHYGHLTPTGAGEYSISCTASGQWSSAPYPCQRVTCPTPEAVPNTNRTQADVFHYEDELEYTCWPGYAHRAGDLRLTCGGNGVWNGSWPGCQKIVCDDPGYVNHSSRILLGVLFQDYVRYGCFPGYLRDPDGGPLNRTCQEDNKWSGIKPRCLGVYCGNPGQVTKATRSGASSFRYPEVVRYTCQPGYRPDFSTGVNEITCTMDGRWDFSLMTCKKIHCMESNASANANILNSGTLYYEEVRHYECYQGYEVVSGLLVQACAADGYFEGSPPICKRVVCGDPGQVAHANRTHTGFSYNDVITVTCQLGYEVQGLVQQSVVAMVCLATRAWSILPPVCARVVCRVLVPDAGAALLSSDGHLYGDNIRFRCEFGHEASSGDAIRVCMKHGKWSGTTFECQPRSCGDPPFASNTDLVGTVFHYGGRVFIRCAEGYQKMSGGEKFNCEADGTWTGTVPVCERVHCISPSQLLGGVLLNSTDFDYRYLDPVLYECKPGYEWRSTSGPLQRACASDGFWGGSSPVCDRVSCGDPGDKKGAYKLGFSYLFADKVNYTCRIGFEAEVGRTWGVLQCGSDKNWTGTPPTCKRVYCGDPGMGNHTTRVVAGFYFEDTVMYKCHMGYRIADGIFMLQCMENRRWSSRVPICTQSPDFNLTEAVTRDSAPAESADSETIGMVGIGLLSSVGCIILLMDLATVWRDISFMYRNIRAGHRRLKRFVRKRKQRNFNTAVAPSKEKLMSSI